MEGRLKELTPMVLMGVFGIVLFLIIPSQIKQLSSEVFGPRFVPYLTAGVIVLSSVSSIIRSLTTKVKNEEVEVEENSRYGALKVILIIICIAFWIFLLPILGFILITLLATAAACLIFGDRSILRISLVSIIFTFGAYYLFAHVFQISLPSGLLF